MLHLALILRLASNLYTLSSVTPGAPEQVVVTKNCTVTADGQLRARIRSHAGKSWVVFYDVDNQEEASCEIAK